MSDFGVSWLDGPLGDSFRAQVEEITGQKQNQLGYLSEIVALLKGISEKLDKALAGQAEGGNTEQSDSDNSG
ncbi:hypothetical protein [Spartinivicinus poritis]|uniref:Uncharacterized protein n=1 Tax=Spartinivicinus poritis TaxID=2994640 RepID=A0ABT5U3R1_9GAMM|nr:hypothetical protein [Spartinivicinus sp. A2-2]MDE1460952.1 hypothetical protein [Spartinivicinus sp. A2-2]